MNMVFQSFNLFSHLSVIENLTLGPIKQGISKEAAENKSMDLLRLVGLAEKAENYPDELSGDKSSVLPLLDVLQWSQKLFYLMSQLQPLIQQW